MTERGTRAQPRPAEAERQLPLLARRLKDDGVEVISIAEELDERYRVQVGVQPHQGRYVSSTLGVPALSGRYSDPGVPVERRLVTDLAAARAAAPWGAAPPRGPMPPRPFDRSTRPAPVRPAARTPAWAWTARRPRR